MKKVQSSKLKTQKGFTLVELLISISIFMIFFAIAAGSYGSLVKANRAANDMQKIYREVRFVFDTLAQEIRNGSLDYMCIDETKLDPLCLENQFGPEKKVLAVLRKDGGRVLFKFDETNKTMLSRSTGNDWQALTTSATPIESLSFSFSPLKNPYESANAGNNDIQRQPSVTIRMKVAGFDFKTTYSSRNYGK